MSSEVFVKRGEGWLSEGGRMVQGIIVELPLAPFFLKQLLRRGVDVNDLATLDEELYRNLMFLRSYEGDVEDLALTFTVTRDIYGDHQEVRSWGTYMYNRRIQTESRRAQNVSFTTW